MFPGFLWQLGPSEELNVQAGVISISLFPQKCSLSVAAGLLATDKSLIRANRVVCVTQPPLPPAQGTSALLHPQTMLITGSVYDLDDTVPCFQTDSARFLSGPLHSENAPALIVRLQKLLTSPALPFSLCFLLLCLR